MESSYSTSYHLCVKNRKEEGRKFLFFRCSAGFVACCTAGFRFAALQDFCRCSAGFGSGSPKTRLTGPLTGVLRCSIFFPAAQHFFSCSAPLCTICVFLQCNICVFLQCSISGAFWGAPGAILGRLDGAFEKHRPVLAMAMVALGWRFLLGLRKRLFRVVTRERRGRE